MLHFLVGKLKVEDVDIFLYALLVRGFRDNHNTPLHIETEDDLCRGLTVLPGDGNEHRGAQQLDKAVLGERLVDKHKVEIVRLQLAHGLHDRCTRLVVAVLRHPYFGRDEQFLAVDAAPVDGTSHGFLVVIRLRRVYQAIACVDGLRHASLSIPVGELEYAEANHRHAYSVVQCYIFHKMLFMIKYK